jgi:hypothetical protein
MRATIATGARARPSAAGIQRRRERRLRSTGCSGAPARASARQRASTTSSRSRSRSRALATHRWCPRSGSRGTGRSSPRAASSTSSCAPTGLARRPRSQIRCGEYCSPTRPSIPARSRRARSPRADLAAVRYDRDADVAQLVEHRSCKADVAGSIPAVGSARGHPTVAHIQSRATADAHRSTQRAERRPELGREQLRLLPGREVAASVNLVEVCDVGVGFLDPAARSPEDLAGERGVADRE